MKIFVANIPFYVSGVGIRQLFELFGAVIAVKIIIEPKTGKSKGFGFVEMQDDQQGLQAIKELDGSTIGDRDIVVKLADQQPEEVHVHKRPRISIR
ncbi:RNA recognition motif domain-containing protein [Mucilaginibacter sp. RCC_168]|jgi:RNA recognition motif-containing protein|uniref:RNA recognition motif domain-containing protein n=1 Tax=Mucilaginibacter sp. RCC_168 TaxID=3239221 RepID=UPI0035234A69